MSSSTSCLVRLVNQLVIAVKGEEEERRKHRVDRGLVALRAYHIAQNRPQSALLIEWGRVLIKRRRGEKGKEEKKARDITIHVAVDARVSLSCLRSRHSTQAAFSRFAELQIEQGRGEKRGPRSSHTGLRTDSWHRRNRPHFC